MHRKSIELRVRVPRALATLLCLSLTALPAVARSALSAQEPEQAVSQPEQSQLPEAAELLDRVWANYGMQALGDWKTISMSGSATFEGMAGEGEYVEQFQRAGAMYTSTILPGAGRFEQGTDGKVFWERDALGVTKPKRGVAAATGRRALGIVRHTPWRELYQGAQVDGLEELEERQLLRLTMHVDDKPDGVQDVWYIDPETERLDRYVMTILGADGQPAAVTTVFSDWRAVQGAWFAHAP